MITHIYFPSESKLIEVYTRSLEPGTRYFNLATTSEHALAYMGKKLSRTEYSAFKTALFKFSVLHQTMPNMVMLYKPEEEEQVLIEFQKLVNKYLPAE